MSTETLTPPPPSTRKVAKPALTKRPRGSMFQGPIVRRAILDSFIKLNPRTEARNPIMFVVEVGAVWTTILFLRDINRVSTSISVFGGLVAAWLWFTVLFANFCRSHRGRQGQGAG